MKKTILAIIIARSKSKGLKNKNIRKINNIPLIGHAAKCANSCKYINETIISTDSKKYGKIAQKYGANFFFLRSRSLSGDNVSDESVLIDGLKKSEVFFKKKFDIIVSLPASTPTRSTKDLNDMISFFIKNKYDSVWSISKTDLKFHPLKQLTIVKNNKLSFYEKKGKNIKNRQQLNDNIYYRNGVAYIINRNFLNRYKKLLGNNSAGFELKGKRISIDNKKDFMEAKKILH